MNNDQLKIEFNPLRGNYLPENQQHQNELPRRRAAGYH